MNKLLVLLLFTFNISYSQYPAGFQEESFGSWDLPMGITFDYNNKMYVWERDGRVYSFLNSQKNLLIDIREEVATYGDFGLLSVALDPNFEQSGYIYLYYVVDRHHLINFGTNNYSPFTNEQGATIARVTRYTLDPNNNFTTLISNSRIVLIGETRQTGFPLTGINHPGGDLKFAVDGSLLVSSGDGVSGEDYEVQALFDGIISTEEYNARRQWRCQIQNSLNGKIIRINPNNGDGFSSNPFFNSANPRSAQSRVWALGFRNPFRFTIKPNTGSHELTAGNPGILLVGDVGQETKEEINVVSEAGQNFGWPRLEGMDFIYSSNPTFHPLSPKKPTIEWGRTGSIARVVINEIVQNVGSQAFPFINFTGGASIGGVFYDGNTYPEEYHGGYFFADFNDQWVKVFNFDSNNNPTAKNDFQISIPGLIYFCYNKNDESIYFTTVTGLVKKIKYAPNENQTPKANFTQLKNYGNSPLFVSFDASTSTDPENSVLTYNWNFGDGSSGTGVKINHTYYANGSNPQTFLVTLTVSDIQGASNSFDGIVSLNNTPPEVLSTSLDSVFVFNPFGNSSVQLNAQVLDKEEQNSSLAFKWEVFLCHNDHRHPELQVSSINANFLFGQVPCDNTLYYYKFVLSITDSYGLKTVFQKDLHPKCNSTDTSPPNFPNLKLDHITNSSFKLSWNQVNDDNEIKNIEVVVNGETQKFLATNSIDYNYFSSGSIIGKNYDAYLIVRDQAGNFSRSSTIYYNYSSNCQSGITGNYLSNLTEVSASNGWGPFEKNKSNGDYNGNDGNTITLNGITFTKGLGVHAVSEIVYNISGLGYDRFKAVIGVDDEINVGSCGSVKFKVFNDNVLAFESPNMTSASSSIDLDISIFGVSSLKLVVEDAGDGICGDHADWADAKLVKNCISDDNSAPSTPLSFIALPQNSGYALSWDFCSDNLDPNLDYEVYVNSILSGIVQSNSFYLPSLVEENNFISVQVKDDIGNRAVSKTIFLKKCPNSINILENQNFSNQTIEKKASSYIQAINAITNQSNVLYQAGSSIQLNNGFSVSNGSVFIAKIGGCLN